MFWGLVLKANKRYSQQVTKAFHVAQATLDINTVGDDKSVVQVWVTIDEAEHLIANLSGRNSHVTMDVTFTEGESVAFYSKGTGTVHLTGYLLPEDDFPGIIGGEEEDEESEEEEVPSKKTANNKKSIKGVQNESDDDEEEDEDDDDDSDEMNLLHELEDDEGEDEEDSEEDDDDDDDEDDEDEEDSDEEEESAKQPPKKMAKLDKGAQNGLTNGKLPKKEKEQKQKGQADQQKNQKNKQDQKQEQKQKNQQQQNQQPQKKQLAGGVQIEDLRVGKGPEAKIGRKISVYYEGRLKSNNKVFDSTKSGDGFQFLLGRGELIRGWDVGIAGMKVGSKRRITCPPNVAYGNKGSPPVIPPNATLVFDVELRGVN